MRNNPSFLYHLLRRCTRHLGVQLSCPVRFVWRHCGCGVSRAPLFDSGKMFADNIDGSAGGYGHFGRQRPFGSFSRASSRRRFGLISSWWPDRHLGFVSRSNLARGVSLLQAGVQVPRREIVSLKARSCSDANRLAGRKWMLFQNNIWSIL